jgi:cystathionine beta-lyase/cystathionine gamma-synthase
MQMLWREDAAALLSASSDVETRAAVSNTNALALVDQLMAHPAVKHVYHPSTETKDLCVAFDVTPHLIAVEFLTACYISCRIAC